MHHVFISYSRRDRAFVERLSKALQDHGTETWVDWEDIPATAAFMDEIQRSIDASGWFLFVISPDSCRSAACREEVAHAAGGGKRLIPIVCRETPATDIPPGVAPINWVSFADGRSFEEALAQLTTALDTDLAWVHAHTELLVRSKQWERLGRSRGALLRGVELSTAEQQLVTESGKQPLVVPLQQEFVVASRQYATRTLRNIIAAVSMALIVTAVLAVLSLRLSRLADTRRQQADEQRQNAEAQRNLAERRRREADEQRQNAETQRNLAQTQTVIARTERDRAEAATKVATKEREIAVSERNRAEDTARMVTAERLADSDPTSAALLLMELHHPLGRGLAAVSAFRRVAERPIASAVMRGHTSDVQSSVFSPDSQRIVTMSNDGTARLWRADGFGAPIVMRHNGNVLFATFSPDGRFIVTGGSDRTARLWPVAGGAPIVLGSHPGPVFWAAVSRDGSTVITRSADGAVRFWSKDGTLVRTVAPPDLPGLIRDVAFTAGGMRAVATKGNVALVWGENAATPPVRLSGHDGDINSAEFSRDASRVVTSSSDGTVRIWSSDGTGEPVILRGPRTRFRLAKFTADGSRVIGAGDDFSVVIWPATGNATPVVRRAPEYVMKLEVSPDGSRFSTTADARNYHLAWIWRTDAPAEPPTVLAGHEGTVYSAVFSPDSSKVVTTGTDGTVRVWPAAGSQEPFVAGAHETYINEARFDQSGTHLVTMGDDKLTRVWTLDGRMPPLVLAPGAELPYPLFNPTKRTATADGKQSVRPQGGTAQGDRVAMISGARGRSPQVLLTGHADKVWATEFSPDDRYVLTASEDGTARVWYADGHDQPLILRLPADQNIVMNANFSPDGTRVLTKTYTTSHRPNDVRVWRVDAASLLSFLRHSTTACLAPDIRTRTLDESPAVAKVTFDACERARMSQ